jgi:hypothetical protein
MQGGDQSGRSLADDGREVYVIEIEGGRRMEQTSYKHDKHRDTDLGKAVVDGATGFQTLIEVREG